MPCFAVTPRSDVVCPLVHRLRQEKSLPPLHTFVIDVISATEASVDDKDAEMLKNTKMSSTFIRRWIVQNQTRVESK